MSLGFPRPRSPHVADRQDSQYLLRRGLRTVLTVGSPPMLAGISATIRPDRAALFGIAIVTAALAHAGTTLSGGRMGPER